MEWRKRFFEGDWKGRTIRGQLRPIFKNGKVVEAIGSYVDISERKRAEEQFAEASEQFESFINNLSDAIILIDVDGNVIKVNPAFETLYGWTSEEVVGGPLPMIPEERRQEFEQLYRELDNGKVISGHTSVRRLKNGVEIHVCLTLSPLRDAHGHITAYAEISRDITDTKIAETALKESEMRYRNLVENAPDAIIIHDHRHILYMNPAGVKMLGSTIEDPRRSIIDFVHPQDAEMLREKMLQILYEQKKERQV